MSERSAAWDSLRRLNPESEIPLYHQLREQLREAAKGLSPHTLVPSESQLMKSAGVSRATARRAVADLVHEGALYTRQGRGTFVAAPRVVTALEQPAGFSETMRSLGRRPSTEVLSLERALPPMSVAEALELPRGAEVWILERLRSIDGEPCMLERAHVPVEVAADLDQLDLSGSLYAALAKRYGVMPEGGTEVIIAANSDRELARLLGVPVAEALLTTVRTTRTTSGLPLEYTLRHARGDLCSFRVTLTAGSALGDRSLAADLLEAR